MTEVSKELQVAVVLDAGRCTGCGHCIDACPTGVFQRETPGARPLALHAGDCHVCFLCVPDCPSGAITVSWDAPNRRLRSIYDVLEMASLSFPGDPSGASID